MFLEVNIDSIIGPTHHYGGLSYGNKASMSSKYLRSNPKQAALQGLEKMEILVSLGIPQFVLPPQIRPDFSQVKQMGLLGTDEELIESCNDLSNSLLSSVFSSSYMWLANAGHFTPSCDALDNRAHFTPSNFSTQFHRVLEISGHETQLSQLFNATVKMHLAISPMFSDEGAANDTRLCSPDFKKGISLFVYGKEFNDQTHTAYPFRQDKEAYLELIKSHKLDSKKIVLAKQSKQAINKGVFHNDVISVGYKDTFLCHEFAFEDQENVLKNLQETYQAQTNDVLKVHVVADKQISLEDCVSSYIFNSQLVETTKDGLIMISPINCEQMPYIKKYIDTVLIPNTKINKCIYLNLQESMRNGGGPACLRLRVLMKYDDYLNLNSSYKLTYNKINDLKEIITKTYPEDLSVAGFSNLEMLKTIYHANSCILDYFKETI
jgi:succinylarginine dihydrolase